MFKSSDNAHCYGRFYCGRDGKTEAGFTFPQATTRAQTMQGTID